MKRPELNFKSNDYVQNVIVLVKKDGNYYYYFSDKEFWIVEYWDGYVSTNGETSIEELYFTFIQPFLVDIDELKDEARKRFSEGDEEVVRLNKPKIYVDFDERLFLSQFFDQALETRLPNTWKGKFENFDEEIPIGLTYWKKDQLA